MEREMDRGRERRRRVEVWARSLLFLSSCVLFCSPAEPHTEPARTVRPGPAGLRFSLEPRPRPGGGGTFQHHSQSKCHLLLTCKTLTIPPPGAAITNGGEWILMGYAIKKEKERKKKEMERKRYSTCSIFYCPFLPVVCSLFSPRFLFGFSWFLGTKDEKNGRERHPLPDFNL